MLDPGDVSAQTDFLPLCYGSVSLVTLGLCAGVGHCASCLLPRLNTQPFPSFAGAWSNWVFLKCFEILRNKPLPQELQVLLTRFLLSALKSRWRSEGWERSFLGKEGACVCLPRIASS